MGLFGGTLAAVKSNGDVFAPAVSDYDVHRFSAGVEYQSGRWTTAAIVQFSPPQTRNVIGRPTSIMGDSPDGRYRSEFLAVGFSATLQF